jgi:hypothetical protein
VQVTVVMALLSLAMVILDLLLHWAANGKSTLPPHPPINDSYRSSHFL